MAKFIVNKVSDSEYYITDYGVCRLEVKEYIETLSSMGFVLSQIEFEAFRDFIDNLERMRLLDKTLEIYPLFGNDLNTFSVKLKYLRTQSLVPTNGFSTSQMELLGSKYIGKNNTTYKGASTPMFNTDVLVSDLNFDFNVSALVGAAIDPTTGGGRYLFGASQIDNATSYTSVGFESFSGIFQTNIGNSSGVMRNTVNNVDGVFSWNTDNYASRTYIEKERVRSYGTVTQNKINTDVEMALFARRGFGANVTLTGGITQKVRFVVVSKGLKIHEIKNLNIEINTLCEKLGKSFA